MIYKFGVICVVLLVNSYNRFEGFVVIIIIVNICYYLLSIILPPIEVSELYIYLYCARGYPYINEEASLKNKNKKTRRDCPLFLFFS